MRGRRSRHLRLTTEGMGIVRERAAPYVRMAGDAGWKPAAALSPRTEIDFLSIHSTAQMSSFDNCCVIECTEY